MINKYNIQTGQIIDASNITINTTDNKTIEQRLYELSSTDFETISSDVVTITDELKGPDGEHVSVEKGFITKNDVPVEIPLLGISEISSTSSEGTIKVNNELLVESPTDIKGVVNLQTLKENSKPLADPGENITVTSDVTYLLEANLDSRLLSAGPWLGCTVYLFNRSGYPQIITTEGKDVLLENNNDLYWVWTGSEWKSLVAGSQLDITDVVQVIKGTLYKWIPDEEGVFTGQFNEEKAPWSITFTDKSLWKLRYGTDSIVFKTENTDIEARDSRGIQEAGLPNIEASWSTDLNTVSFLPMGDVVTGSFATDGSTTNTFQPTSSYVRTTNTSTLRLDASLSSPIYGNSETVTSKNVSMRLYEFIGESVFAKAIKQSYASFEADDLTADTIIINNTVVGPEPLLENHLTTKNYVDTVIDSHTIGFGLGTACIYPPNNDWNQAKSNGWYMSSNASNAPDTNWFMGLVTVHNSNWVRQELTQFSTGTGSSTPHIKYVRQSYDSSGSIVWGPWFVEDSAMRTLTSISSALMTNTIYSIGNRSSNIAIYSATGFGEIRFTTTANISVSIPSSHRWALGTNTSFFSGHKYIISWDDGIWLSVAADF